MIRIPTPGAETTSLMFIPSQPAPRSMGRNTRIGNEIGANASESRIAQKIPPQPRVYAYRADDRGEHFADPRLDRNTELHQLCEARARISTAAGSFHHAFRDLPVHVR